MHKDLKEHKVTIYSPSDGCQLVSIKTRPNNPCFCGSGKKQKRCCGNKQKFTNNKPTTLTQIEPAPVTQSGVEAPPDPTLPNA